MSPQLEPEHLHKLAFRAMGCQMAIWLQLEESEPAAMLLKAAAGMFHDAERRLSRFDSSSELSYVNARPDNWIHVSDMFWSVLTQALFMARETDGLFDPTQLTALEAAGYSRSFEQMPMEVFGSDTAANRFGYWQTVQQDAQKQAILLPSGLKLDFGGIAKGYTAQRVVRYLSDWGSCLVDAGGDLNAGAAPRGWPGWPVAVLAPFDSWNEERTELFSLWLVDGAMATSGVDYRRWQQRDRTVHHVIDPRTSLSAQTDLLTATVFAREATRAEAWSTASLVAGATVAEELLTTRNLAAALVDQQINLRLTPALEPFLEVNIIQLHS